MEAENNRRHSVTGSSGWYPGKYLRRSISPVEGSECHHDDSSEIPSQNEKEGWYPGKFISKKLARSAHHEEVEDKESSVKSPERESDWPYPWKNRGKGWSKSSPSQSEDDSDGKDVPKPSSASRAKDDARKLLLLEDEIIHEKPKNNSPPKPIYGKVKVTLHSIRYFNFGRASVLVELDDKQSFHDLSASQQSYMEDVPIDFTTDLGMSYFPSDVIITLNGKPTMSTKGIASESVNTIGVAVLPLVRYTTVFGMPIKASPEWVLLYPAKFNRSGRKRYMSGFSDFPGFAMNRCKDPVGFLQVSVEIVELTRSKNVMPLYFIAEPRFPNVYTVVDSTEQEDSLQITTTFADEGDLHIPGDSSSTHGPTSFASQHIDALSIAVCNRDLQRLRRVLFSPPSLLAAFVSLPKVFVLIAFAGFLIYSASIHHIPILLVFGLFLNGIVTSSNRSYAHVIVWNDPHAPESASTGKGAMVVQRSWNAILSTLSYTVRCLEVGVNLLGFADVRMSLIVYTVLQATAILSSIIIKYFWARFFIFGSTALSLLVWVLHDIVFEFVEYKATHPAQAAVLMKLVLNVKWAIRMLENFFSKVPDDLEMTHRYISRLQLTKEKGVDMVEAAAEFKATKK